MYSQKIGDLFAETGPISRRKQNYKPRPSQIEAAKKIFDEVLQNQNHMILEGPCGFGKTFAYLFPLCLYMMESTETHKAVIATNGIALSEQLFYQDIPAAIGILAEEFPDLKVPSFALFKGKQNFLCRVNYDSDADSIKDRNLLHWMKHTITGDFSELKEKPDPMVQSAFSCAAENDCSGGSCPMAKECFYNKHKAKAVNSDIIVTNYHLLFSDEKTNHNLLPTYDILIMDEAHEVPNIYRNFAELRFTSLGFQRHRNNLLSIAQEMPKSLFSVFALCTEKPDVDSMILNKLWTEFISEFETMTRLMSPLVEHQSQHILRAAAALPNKEKTIQVLDELIEEIRDTMLRCSGYLDEYPDVPELVRIVNRCSTASEQLLLFKDWCFDYTSMRKQNESVFFIEKTPKGEALCQRFIQVGDKIFNNYLDSPTIESCILTSATLSVGGTFDFIKREMGLDQVEELSKEVEHSISTIKDKEEKTEGEFDLIQAFDENPQRYLRQVVEHIGDSPFDLEQQQLWYLPPEALDGNDANFQPTLKNNITPILESVQGGILFLCTSNRMLEHIYEIVCENPLIRKNKICVLKQGMASTKNLIEEFQSDKDSILVATKTFFTGIDVPGQALRCVVIDKLPFPNPSDPVMKRLAEMDAQSFRRYFIPMMVMQLKQAIGRGVRSESDKCVIAFLDGRMKSANYAGTIRKSFNWKTTATREADALYGFLYGGNCNV